MVRFKNRHLLVEFLTPSTDSPSLLPLRTLPVLAHPTEPTEDFSDGEDELTPIPPLPFLVPHHDPSISRLKLGDEGGGVIFRAIRGIIQEVFGDEGWGRVASSFKGPLSFFPLLWFGSLMCSVVYHSPMTTLSILRIARQHYRLIWAGVSLLTSINGQAVVPRVVAVSGTIKKLQNRAVAYHRLVTGQMLVAATERSGET